MLLKFSKSLAVITVIELLRSVLHYEDIRISTLVIEVQHEAHFIYLQFFNGLLDGYR